MKAWVLSILAMAGMGAAIVAQSGTVDRQALRARIEQRYEVVVFSDALTLRPRDPAQRAKRVRLIDVTGGTIALDGATVTGGELRERLGADADAILQLSYLSAEDQRALFAAKPPDPGAAAPLPPVERGAPPHEAPRHEEPAHAEPRPDDPDTPRRARRASGDRVRIFGDVTVEKDEEITGQVVAVLGSVRIDGEVGDQVVAVLGSVNLGPTAIVRGDVVSVGGRIRRAPGSQTRAGVTEVALADGGFPVHVGPWMDDWGPFMWFDGFGALPRLIGSGFRAVLMLLLAGLALVFAGRSVEASAERMSVSPVKTTVVGLVAEILIPPVLVIIAIVMAISIIGIPLLLLLPFLILFLLLMAVVGFAGASAAIGRAVQRRFALGDGGAFFSICIGVLVILSPLLVGRMLALAGWPASPFSFLLIAAGFAVELLVWAGGFGAVLTNAFTRVQAHRAARHGVPAPPVA